MKVWELKEGKLYTSSLCDNGTIYKLIDGDLHYKHPTINYGDYVFSCMEYNRAKTVDFTEYTPPTDWSKVEVDTKVLVRNKGDRNWYKRHFAKYCNGKIYTWRNGLTSWSDIYPDYERTWDEVKLYTEE